MNLYRYLMHDAPTNYKWDYPMTERQLKFLDDLLKDIPLIQQYLERYNYGSIFFRCSRH